jgi:DNA polymerase I-like protein with 3'-5' exonuclease and polymerase domains
MLRDLVVADLNPPLNVTFIQSPDNLPALTEYLSRVDAFTIDLETNVTDSFLDRKIRTIQIGDRNEQYVIDLLAFAGTKERLLEQGWFTAPEWSRPVVDVILSALENRDRSYLKVGVNLQFEYQALYFCLGIRPWNFYDCWRVEQVLYSGKVHFKEKGFWGMEDMFGRYTGLRMDKSAQKSFDLESELTPEQIQYAALDCRIPFAIRAGQMQLVTKLKLEEACRIENHAIPSFGDMHLNGIYLDPAAWLEVVEDIEKEHVRNVSALDKFFIPVMGTKDTPPAPPISDEEFARLEEMWRTAPSKTQEQKDQRKEYRKAWQNANKTRNDIRNRWEKTRKDAEGEAAINYGSSHQLKAALYQMGFTKKKLPNTNDRTLETLKGEPVIATIQEYRTTQKLLDTYGRSFLENIDPITGRVHSEIDQLGAESGRTSSSKPNCFSPDTEVLTPRGWVRFDRLDKADKVAEYDPDSGDIRFSHPIAYIENDFEGELLHLHTEQEQIDMLVTPDHDCLLRHRKTGQFRKFSASNYVEDWHQIVAGGYVGGDQKFTKDEVIVICALQADGSVTDHIADFTFRKSRKIHRLCTALRNLHIPFRFYERMDGGTRISFKWSNAPNWLREKKMFGPWLMDLDRSTLSMLAEEIWFWDGCFSRHSHYSSSIKTNADWVQIVQILSGVRAKLRPYRNSNPNAALNWQVDSSTRPYVMTSNRMITPVPYKGKVYCVTMPWGTVVIRRNNTVAITGNCQNIPSRTEIGRRLRACFRARPGYAFVSVDMAGAELRILAELSQDPIMIAAFANGWDLHSVGAEIIFGQEWKDAAESNCAFYHDNHKKCKCPKHSKLRDWVKNINFGIAYGMEAKKLADDLSISIDAAKELLDKWRKAFKVAWAYLLKSGQSAKMTMKSLTMSGRVRYYPKPDWDKCKEYAQEDFKKAGKDPLLVTHKDISRQYSMKFGNIERQGKNSPIQGTNADILKLALGTGSDSNGVPFLWHQIQKFDCKLVLEVHDESDWEVREDQAEEFVSVIGDAYKRAAATYMKAVVMSYDANIGDRWKK